MKLLQHDEIKNTLLEIYNIIKDFSDIEIMHNSSDLILRQFKILDSMAAIPVDDLLVRALENDPDLKPVVVEISRFRKLYNIKLEIERAEIILSSNIPWKVIESFTFYHNYLELAKTEVNGADLHKGDHIIFVGAGPLPLSLIILCRHYGVTGTGIEQNHAYANISKRIINKLNMSEEVNILHGNHFSLPLQKEAQIIMIAAAAIPKQEIFAHLNIVLKKGTKVSYRIYEKGFRKFLDPTSCISDNNLDKMQGLFKEYRRISPEPPVNNTCVFLTK